MKILTKAITDINQIKARIGLAKGIEVALMGRIPTLEMVSLLRDNFTNVNFESSDALQRRPTYRLIDPFSDDKDIKEESRRLIEESFNIFLSLNNKGYFTIHNVAFCRQQNKPYQLPSFSEINERKDQFHNYITSLDKGKEFISLENIFPNQINDCPYDYGDFGKLFNDFPHNIGISFDIGHYTITLAMYAYGIKRERKNNFVSLTRDINFLSFILGIKTNKKSLSTLVKEAMQSLGDRVKVIHCTNVRGLDNIYDDGFLEGILNLEEIIRVSKAKYIVPEVKNEDYIKYDESKKLINYLNNLLKN